MNRLLLLCFALVSSTVLLGQYSTKPPIDLKRISLDEKSWITTTGFPLNEYDYSNPTINLELTSALREKKQGELFSTISYVALGTSTLLLFAPFLVDDLDFNRTIPTMMMIGGLAFNLTGMYKKIGARKRVQNAHYLFNDQ